MVAGAVGNIVPAIGYAAVGAYAATFVNALTVFALVISVAGLVWLVQYRVRNRVSAQREEVPERR